MTCSRCMRRPSAVASSFTRDAAPRRLHASDGTWARPTTTEKLPSNVMVTSMRLPRPGGVRCEESTLPPNRREEGASFARRRQCLEHLHLVDHRGADPPQQWLHLVAVPLEAGDLVADLEELRGEQVALALVAVERLGLGSTPGERVQDRTRQQVRVAQRVGHPVRADGVLEVPGIAHQGPPRPPRPPDEPAPAGPPVEAPDAG